MLFRSILKVCKAFLPCKAYTKLETFLSQKKITTHNQIDWEYFKKQMKNINTTLFATEIITILKQNTVNISNVKIFHIGNNNVQENIQEPSLSNVAHMIYEFLTYIYQRNIVTTLIKYVLLHDLLHKFDSSDIITNKRGIFVLIKQRLHEILFECCLTAFNGSNYDNYLLLNSLILIMSRMKQKIRFFKKGASISTIFLRIKQFRQIKQNGFNMFYKNKRMKSIKSQFISNI